jgi:hypothetical protein
MITASMLTRQPQLVERTERWQRELASLTDRLELGRRATGLLQQYYPRALPLASIARAIYCAVALLANRWWDASHSRAHRQC